MTRYYSETEVVAEIRGLSVTRLRAWVAAECLVPAEREGHLAFAEIDVARLRLLADLADALTITELDVVDGDDLDVTVELDGPAES